MKRRKRRERREREKEGGKEGRKEKSNHEHIFISKTGANIKYIAGVIIAPCIFAAVSIITINNLLIMNLMNEGILFRFNLLFEAGQLGVGCRKR